MFCICFGTCKTEVQENIFYFPLRWPANHFIFHNFVYTDQPLNVSKIVLVFVLK